MDFTPVILPFVNEALKVLGLWAVAPIAVVFVLFEVRRKLMAKDAEIAALRRENAELHDKRLQDAREMIRIAESGTAATAARVRSDERVADLLEALLRKTSGGGLFGWRR
jgi:beta-lactamase regulating signal transducer with metallopeptidase domain